MLEFTRNYLVAALAGTPDVIERLLQELLHEPVASQWLRDKSLNG